MKKFTTCEEMDNFYDTNRNNPSIIDYNKLTKEHQILFDQYEYLINLPQPVQKSPEWFALRNNMITASSCGSVLGECKYQTIKETLLEKIFGKEFKENKFVYHGKKYEKIATMIYEVIYNSKVGEFGLIPHPTIDFLGASPDGISMSLTLDCKPNKILGRMLEIKCPPSRKIQTTGLLKGDICPSYYWIQVQIQLECCNLPECDFWQCHLVEYDGEKEFIEDNIVDNIHTHSEIYEQTEMTEIIDEKNPIIIDNRICRGAIIELLPVDRSKIPKGDLVEWYAKYIYPPTLLYTPIEYKKWSIYTIKNIKILYPDFNTTYKFSRVVYWKLIKSHNELITRLPEWFKKKYNILEKFWNRVKYYREHSDEAKEDIQNQRLSNSIFLSTEDNKIPKTKSSVQYKKQYENIFIKLNNNIDKKELTKELIKEKDVFASSESEDKIDNNSILQTKTQKEHTKTQAKTKTQIQKEQKEQTKTQAKTKTQIQKEEKEQTKTQAKTKTQIQKEQTKIPQPELLYKNQGNLYTNTNLNSDDEINVVIIKENRKKKNIKK